MALALLRKRGEEIISESGEKLSGGEMSWRMVAAGGGGLAWHLGLWR